MAFEIDYVSKTLTIFAISLVICGLIYKWFRERNYPPGPVGLPGIGYGLFLGDRPHLTMQSLGEKYGGIFSFYTGPQLIICVTEYHLIKEILSLPNTLDRPPHSLDFLVGKAGMGSLGGDEWKEQRRFTMHNMRNLGLGRGPWETIIQENAIDLVNELKKLNGKAYFFEPLLSKSQIITIMSLLFGRQLDAEAEKQEIEEVYVFSKEMLFQMSSTNISLVLPSLFKVLEFFNYNGLKKFMKQTKKVGNFIENEVEKRIKSFEKDTDKDDFIYYYLKEMEKVKNDRNTSFTVENLIGNIFIFLIGGHDSSVASMGWMLLLMAKHPEIQKKIHEEIDREIGRDGAVYYEDKVRLPYTLASILEMLRWVSISGVFPARYVSEGFSFGKYEIPQGALVMCNAYAMMHDSNYFKNPMEYQPERFIADDGSVKLYNIDSYGPFSFGRRNCPGEGVAVMTVYLYFTTIMQKFLIEPPAGKVPNMDYIFSAAVLPFPQELCFIER